MAYPGVGAVSAGNGAAVAPAHHSGLQRLAGVTGDEQWPATVAVARVGAAFGIAGAEHRVGGDALREVQEGVAGTALDHGNLGSEQGRGDLRGIRVLVGRAGSGYAP